MELKILDWIQALHNPVTDVLFVWITRLGNVGMIWILLAAVLLLRRKTRKTDDILAAALVVDVLLCNGLLKHLFHRIRPCDVNTAVSLLVSRLTDYSFPSGHTAASFAAVAALVPGRRTPPVEARPGAGNAHCFFQAVSVRPLPVGYPGRGARRSLCRMGRQPDRGKAAEMLPGACPHVCPRKT